MKLRTQILLFLFLFAVVPLVAAVLINLPLVLDRLQLFYQQAYLQNLRADFRDLDQHLASRDEMVRLLSKLPEPGSVLGIEQDVADDEIDLARARYTEWVNQVLGDQLDVVQILFLDEKGQERFWLERDPKDLSWQPTTRRPRAPPPRQVEAALALDRPGVLVSPIVVDPEAGTEDPRQYMTLKLASPLGVAPGKPAMGVVVMTVDVAGIAHRYRNTLWVHDNGDYLQPMGLPKRTRSAFEDFPGLREQFATGDLALWSGPQARQVMWVPLLRTASGEPLWVGRPVDPSPLQAFQQALTLRVLSIILALTVVIWLVARRFAVKAERFGRELTEGIRRMLEEDAEVRFEWHDTQELRDLGASLSRLAEKHARNNRSLRAHARQLEESNRYKSEFLANVSHELRTPLNSILLLSKLLAEDTSELSPDKARQARVIHAAGKDLQSLIDNILDLSRIEARGTAFNLERIDLSELLSDTLELVRPQFDAKGLALTLRVTPDAPREIQSDPDKLRQIVKNFLSNAVKFTSRGGVTVRLDANRQREPSRWPLLIAVTDTGIGIPKDKQAVVFEAFKQADGSTSRKYGGSGLGLTISRELARLVGGAIELDSEEGLGSTFTLYLPSRLTESGETAGPAVEAPDAEAAAAGEGRSETGAAAAPRFDGLRVLVVDDDVDTLLRVTPALERCGIAVSAAGDVPEALETLQEDPDVAALLWGLPVSGPEAYATIQRVRAMLDGRGVTVIMLGDDTTAGEPLASLGAIGVLEKPVDPAALQEMIGRHLRPAEAERATDRA
ncbi:MAG: ATP-binding protein [Gammaproteobacteria bacterium]|nr:ATP-binding protein [Gammaproteobacteria bacterium]